MFLPAVVMAGPGQAAVLAKPDWPCFARQQLVDAEALLS